MVFVVLYKYLNCAVDKTIDTEHTASTDCASTDCNTNYRIKLLIISFITSWCKPLKTHPPREICNYATSAKPSFAK